MDQPYVTRIENTVHSTQDSAKLEFDTRNDSIPVLVVAGHQSAGRGRSGHEWWTAPRALLASVAIAAPADDVLTLVPLAAGVAAHDAVKAELNVATTLKWPNDIMLGPAKVGGVLSEVAGHTLVVGLGLNLWWPEPPEATAALATEDPGENLAVPLAKAWADRLTATIGNLPESFVLNRYEALCATIGSHITWQPDGAGLATGIAADGSLLVDADGSPVSISSGEVTHVRPASLAAEKAIGDKGEVAS